MAPGGGAREHAPMTAADPSHGLPYAHERRACRQCGATLGALEALRGDVCGALDCRRRAGEAVARARRAGWENALRDAASPVAAPVLWLTRHPEEFAAPPAEELTALRAHLVALQDADPASASQAPANDWTPAAGAAAVHLCTLCRGRCCRLGLPHHAFLTRRNLDDWLARHDLATWADAVGHYLRQVPARHLAGSCLFHGEAGCTLARETRSDVCNAHVCDTLAQLRDRVDAAPDSVAIVGVADAHGVRAAAVVGARASRALTVHSA